MIEALAVVFQHLYGQALPTLRIALVCKHFAQHSSRQSCLFEITLGTLDFYRQLEFPFGPACSYALRQDPELFRILLKSPPKLLLKSAFAQKDGQLLQKLRPAPQIDLDTGPMLKLALKSHWLPMIKRLASSQSLAFYVDFLCSHNGNFDAAIASCFQIGRANDLNSKFMVAFRSDRYDIFADFCQHWIASNTPWCCDPILKKLMELGLHSGCFAAVDALLEHAVPSLDLDTFFQPSEQVYKWLLNHPRLADRRSIRSGCCDIAVAREPRLANPWLALAPTVELARNRALVSWMLNNGFTYDFDLCVQLVRSLAGISWLYARSDLDNQAKEKLAIKALTLEPGAVAWGIAYLQSHPQTKLVDVLRGIKAYQPVSLDRLVQEGYVVRLAELPDALHTLGLTTNARGWLSSALHRQPEPVVWDGFIDPARRNGQHHLIKAAHALGCPAAQPTPRHSSKRQKIAT